MDAVHAQATLGVSRRATHAEIRRAYARALRQHHPDTGDGDARALEQIRVAYRELAPGAVRTIVPGTYGYGRPPVRPQLVDVYA
jgi:DnaJ-class molecular chaperone